MKFLKIATVVLTISVFGSCSSPTNISGRYVNTFAGIASTTYRLSAVPNKFEYAATTEGILRGYSAGTWKFYKRTIVFSGFDDNSINALNLVYSVDRYPNEHEHEHKIIISYKEDTLDTFIKVDMVTDGNTSTRIHGDTTYFIDLTVKTLQLRSYLQYEGALPGMPALIDTLYSPLIRMDSIGKFSKLALELTVDQRDFYRTKLVDTLVVRNRHMLIGHGVKYKRVGN